MAECTSPETVQMPAEPGGTDLQSQHQGKRITSPRPFWASQESGFKVSLGNLGRFCLKVGSQRGKVGGLVQWYSICLAL